MSTLVKAALMALILSSCTGEEFSEEDCGEAVDLKMMSYNLANAKDATLQAIAQHIVDTDADFIAVQECPCDELLAVLPDKYRLSQDPRSGVTIVYDQEKWLTLYTDFLTLGDNDDGWGERVMHWARFSHRESGHCVNVYTTHFCVSIRSPDDSCDVERQLAYLDKTNAFIQERQSPLAPSLFAGDFNVFDGFESGPVLERIKSQGFVDLLRQFESDDTGPTFQGNSWAPEGRIDYIFSSSPVDVLDAYVDRESVLDGQGSDHYALVSTLRFLLSE